MKVPHELAPMAEAGQAALCALVNSDEFGVYCCNGFGILLETLAMWYSSTSIIAYDS